MGGGISHTHRPGGRRAATDGAGPLQGSLACPLGVARPHPRASPGSLPASAWAPVLLRVQGPGLSSAPSPSSALAGMWSQPMSVSAVMMLEQHPTPAIPSALTFPRAPDPSLQWPALHLRFTSNTSLRLTNPRPALISAPLPAQARTLFSLFARSTSNPSASSVCPTFQMCPECPYPSSPVPPRFLSRRLPTPRPQPLPSLLRACPQHGRQSDDALARTVRVAPAGPLSWPPIPHSATGASLSCHRRTSSHSAPHSLCSGHMVSGSPGNTLSG